MDDIQNETKPKLKIKRSLDNGKMQLSESTHGNKINLILSNNENETSMNNST